MSTKKVKIFDKVLDKLEPICEIEELGIKIYDPDYLSKAASLAIFDFQNTAGFLYDLIKEKSSEIYKLSEQELNDANLKRRKEIANEIVKINDQLDDERCNYIEIVCKLKKGELIKKLEAYLEENEQLEELPIQQLIKDVYQEVNNQLADFKKSETDINESDSVSKKE